ncbi:MAG: metallophosphoesterase [Clostridia bacterium]|nr:metallophosphoesterase [Clostridia bacterium]
MRKFKKLMAVLVSLAIVLCLAQPAATAIEKGSVTGSINFAVVSDIHLFPQEMMGNKGDAWLTDSSYDGKLYNESEAILAAALRTIGEQAEENGTEYLLIPGDLTKDSEYLGHVKLASILEQFEKDYGVPVIVINGNHDIMKECVTYENDIKEKARSITAAEFRQVYKNLGYDLATEEFKPTTDDGHGQLSYVVDLNEDYRLIVVDSNIYSNDTADNETGGYVTDEQLDWILEKADEATRNGQEPFVMIHHGMGAHMKVEPSVTSAFVLDDYLNVAEIFADNGINFAFTGHLHTHDIASVTSDDGNILYDVETPSLTGFPCQYRNVEFKTYQNNDTEATFSTEYADNTYPISVDGVTYEKGEFYKAAFKRCYGGALTEDGAPHMATFLTGMAMGYINEFLPQIIEAGGILEFLKTMGLDVRELLDGFLSPYIGDGIGLGGYSIFSVDNLMWFIEDLCAQIEETILTNPEELEALIFSVADKLLTTEVSELPCDQFIEEYGFGSKTEPGTLDDVILSVLHYYSTGLETADENEFIMDVINNFENGDKAQILFDTLLDIVLNDILDEALLSKLEIRLDTLFDKSANVGEMAGHGVQDVLGFILRGDYSYQNLIDTIFELGVLPYTGLQDALEKTLIEEYITDSQIESIGHVIAYFLEDFATDSDPIANPDTDVTYSTAQIEPIVSRENYRLPTMVSVTMGDDSKTSANISWFSKSTLEATDIEIYEYIGKTVKFTGVPTESASFSISTEEELVERYYPGIDIGIAGLFNYTFNMYRHTVTLTDLKPGTKYVYRVGNTERGWWSEVGTVETADGSDEVTFFHMCDPQSQNLKQYTRGWANTVEQAFNLYPDAKFIVNTGDLVDHGMNVNQWQWLFDTASDDLMSTYLMPVSGNHEEMDDYSLAGNFILPNAPEQDTTTGVYYSYDYNNVHVSVLNTNEIDSTNGLESEQVEWLKQDIANSDADWNIVALHKAIYSNGSHYDDGEIITTREQLSKLMPELGIDLVLQGHDHVYMRTHSIDSNEVVSEEKVNLKHNGEVYEAYVNPTGTSYAISGCSGVKVYNVKDVSLTDELFPRAAKAVDVDTQIFSSIQIDGGVLYFNAYTVDGDEVNCIDKFAIEKDGSGVETDEPADITADVVIEEEEDVLSIILEYVMKIATIACNIFRMYVIDYLLK